MEEANSGEPTEKASGHKVPIDAMGTNNGASAADRASYEEVLETEDLDDADYADSDFDEPIHSVNIKDLLDGRARRAGSKEGQSYKQRREDAELEGIRNDITAKKKMGKKAFLLVAIWLAVVMLTLWLTATGCFWGTEMSFHISDTVLLALITTTTANVALFLTYVINHLFPNQAAVKKATQAVSS